MLNKQLNLLILITALLVLNACGDDESTFLLDCDKITSRENAETLMQDTHTNRFTDSEVILDNLIGDWGLIAVVSGWAEFEAGVECLSLQITTDKIILTDHNTGATSSSDWELKTFEVNGFVGYYMDTNEPTFSNRMGMQIFTSEIMWGDGRVDDANTYIYEKLN